MKYIFLSPHQDDAVLSCGGLLRKHGKNCLVITIYAGKYDGLTLWDKFCRFKNGDRPWYVRNCENSAALTMLGVSNKHLDIIQERYQGIRNKNIQATTASETLKHIFMKNSAGEKIYAPLGIGNPDHENIRCDVLKIFTCSNISKQYELNFYEDFPYIIRKDWTNNAHSYYEYEKIKISPYIEDITIQFNEKLKAIMEYKSQIKQVMVSIFPGDRDEIETNCSDVVEKVLRTYSRLLRPDSIQSQNCYYERYWTCLI